MNLKHIPLLTATLLASGTATSAQTQLPNLYECYSFNTKVSLLIGNTNEGGVSIYPTTSHMDISIGTHDFSFSEEQIMRESTLIGDLWEVMLSGKEGAYADYATLVIPSLMNSDEPVQFMTKLVLTRVYRQDMMTESKATQSFLPNLMNLRNAPENPSKYISVYCTGSTLFF